MKLLMMGHLLGDFYFQTNRLAEKKKTSFTYTVLHCFVYSLVMLVVLVITTGKLVGCILPTLEYNIDWIPGIPESYFSSMQEAPIIICAFLLCGKPAAIIVSLVFELIPKTIEKADFESVKIIDGSRKENARIGSWIGILEREIIFILGLLGQYGAIGFVIAAKSLARHSQLNEPAFAEKYLIGTLLSSFMALVCIMICKVF